MRTIVPWPEYGRYHRAMPQSHRRCAGAAPSMFELVSSVSQGVFLVERVGRIVWVNEGYRRFLPDLGLGFGGAVRGSHGGGGDSQHPGTARTETGQPVLIDLLTNRAVTFVVSRIPLRDEAQ